MLSLLFRTFQTRLVFFFLYTMVHTSISVSCVHTVSHPLRFSLQSFVSSLLFLNFFILLLRVPFFIGLLVWRVRYHYLSFSYVYRFLFFFWVLFFFYHLCLPFLKTMWLHVAKDEEYTVSYDIDFVWPIFISYVVNTLLSDVYICTSTG